MRTIIWGILCLILLLPGSVLAETYDVTELKTAYKEGILVYMDDNDRPVTGLVRELYADGVIKSDGHVVNGKRTGPHYDYYSNGKVKTETEFKDGLRHGMSRDYTEQGQLNTAWMYNSNQKHGPMREYDQNTLVAETP